jgi:cyclopropane-fatty-acyl-phospholipid synthase
MKKIIYSVLGLLGALGVGYAVLCYSYSADDAKKFAEKLLAQADIQINGDRPWDMIVHNDQLFTRVLKEGSLGLGEAYMDGWWDCKALDQFFYRVLKAELDQKLKINVKLVLNYLYARFCNLQTKTRSKEVGELHYDLSNELFQKMLDPWMIYSCGYWKDAKNLNDAQEHKLNLICKKLKLKPGMRLLDIGCGWGGLARYAAQHYGVTVVGVTISKEQAKYAKEKIGQLPVKIRLQDYRDLNEQFDRIVSVGMFEHVGYKNYKEFMTVAQRCLKDDGLLLVHTIGSNTTNTQADPWIDKYIFRNSLLPSVVQIAQSFENIFILEDWHNFGPDYDTTLMAWYENFLKHWPELRKVYDKRFYRMWTYYLLSCAGLFRARKAQLWQIVLSKELLGGYESVR